MSAKTHHTFETPEQLHAWLQAHHASETELWVRIFKKGHRPAHQVCPISLFSLPAQVCDGRLKDLPTALLHKPEASRDNPSPRRSYATAGTGTVAGRPSCVKRLSKATRTCSSVTWRSNVRAITRSPKRLKQCILVSTRLLR